MNRRVIVAMSGGVDSSVSALLLKKQGYDVIGVALRLWDYSGAESVSGGRCSSMNIKDARVVAEGLGIPFHVVNLEEVFRKDVVKNFIEEYTRGRTPNPCILCNEKIKFSGLLKKATELEADFLATGHYARKLRSRDNKSWQLLRGGDAQKDQSYFLFTLSQAVLERTLFPVGEMKKKEVRRLAHEAGLLVADKRESQEVCFVQKKGLGSFFRETIPPRDGKGEFVTRDGRALGRHSGYCQYTIGQRHGLGISSPSPLYVIGIDPERNRVIVGREKDLYHQELIASSPRWISGMPPDFPLHSLAQIRSRHEGGDCEVVPYGDGRLRVSFVNPQRAITPGQAVVFYNGDEVLGGAWIESSL